MNILTIFISLVTGRGRWLQFCLVFRFIAERGEGGQLIHVEKIDEAFKLKALAGGAADSVIKVASSTPERPLPLLSGKPR